MSRVRSKDTKPELLVRKFLFSKGFRYKLHDKSLPGTPDIILPKYKTVIFINGCFWHGHNDCKYAALPKTKTEWWQAKIQKNAANDESAKNRLLHGGWNVVLIWGCELKSKLLIETLVKIPGRIISKLL